MFNMRAKKSLGQNFLNSARVAKDIANAGIDSLEDIVLEIGPGKGILTQELLTKAKKVYAVEKDERLIVFLKKKFEDEIKNGKLILIQDDILNFDLTRYTLHATRYTLVANIPYYITGEVLRKFLSGSSQPKTMVLMLQKEVAERIVARDKKESILSLSVKVYGTPRIIKKVPARYFNPVPKVDSAILTIKNISKANFTNQAEEDSFFKIIKSGFAHRRKFAIRNLEHLFINKDILDSFSACKIDQKARAENISLSKWLCLTKRS